MFLERKKKKDASRCWQHGTLPSGTTSLAPIAWPGCFLPSVLVAGFPSSLSGSWIILSLLTMPFGKRSNNTVRCKQVISSSYTFTSNLQWHWRFFFYGMSSLSLSHTKTGKAIWSLGLLIILPCFLFTHFVVKDIQELKKMYWKWNLAAFPVLSLKSETS